MSSRSGGVKAFAALATAAGLAAGAAGLSGCSHGGGASASAAVSTAERVIPVTVQKVQAREVERTVEVVGTLKGWEQVTIGAKRGGRVLKVFHDMGDHVRPGEPLIELDDVDARLALFQARSRYFAELTKLGITNDQAETAIKKFGITEELLMGEQASRLIEQSPAIVQANTLVEKAATNVSRVRSLYQRGAGALEELQNFENDYKAAKAGKDSAVATARNIIANAIAAKVAIDAAEQTLKDLIVLVPVPSKLPEKIDPEKLTYGVTKRYVSEGQILRDGDPVMDLVIEQPLRLWSNVPERFSSDVTVGQPVRVTVASASKPYEGTVARINPSIDPISRTFQAEAHIPNPDGEIRPGGFAKASIQTEKRSQALVVPIESVVKFAGVTKVFVVVDGKKARAVNVETGLEGPGWVEVRGPLQAGDEVVTTGQTQLAEGTPVQIRSPEEDAARAKAEEEKAKAGEARPEAEDAPKPTAEDAPKPAAEAPPESAPATAPAPAAEKG